MPPQVNGSTAGRPTRSEDLGGKSKQPVKKTSRMSSHLDGAVAIEYEGPMGCEVSIHFGHIRRRGHFSETPRETMVDRAEHRTAF
jgi:hypothetical protein